MKKNTINLKVLILPFLNVLMFVILSSFGQSFMMNIGLSFIFSLIFILIYIINLKKIPPKVNMAFMILISYSLLKSLLAMDLYYGIISIGTVCSFSLLVGIKMDTNSWKKSFIITSIFSTVVLILYNMKYVLVNWNPNSIGGFCSLGMMMSILTLFSETKKRNKILIIMFILYQVLQLYLTDCRTATFIFVIAFIFSLIFTTFSNKQKKKKNKIYIMFLLSCLLFSLLATQYVKLSNSEAFDWLIDLSKQLFNKSTLFSDREYIWNICDYLSQNFWFLGSGKSLYHILYSHNMYYSIQYTYGFLGYILYCFFLFTTCNYIYRRNISKFTYASIIIFASILLGQITENTMFTSDSNIFMSYIYLSIGLSSMKGKDEKNEEINSFYSNIQ